MLVRFISVAYFLDYMDAFRYCQTARFAVFSNFFKLYALDSILSLESGATKDRVEKAMEGHILAEGQLMGKYKR